MTDLRWTGEQARAIQTTSHAMLAANAGTGKTTTVVGKILWHLGLDIGVDASTGKPIPPCPAARRVELAQVAAITFTEKAAFDLKRKLRQEIESRQKALLWDLDRARIGTIHSFCGELLREHALRFGIDASYRVFEERESQLEQYAIAKEVVMEALEAAEAGVVEYAQDVRLEGLGDYGSGLLDHVLAMFRDMRWHAGRYQGWTVNGQLDAGRLRKLAESWDAKDDTVARNCQVLHQLASRVRERWEAVEKDQNARDFDSLILACRDLLNSDSSQPALDEIRRRIGLFIIDEFQDTDEAQRDIAFRIAAVGEKDVQAPQLFVVGDPKQSIYGFRGADITVWNDVEKALGGAKAALPLTENFRSDPAVIDYVNRTCDAVMKEVGKRVRAVVPESEIAYVPLVAARKAAGTGEIEWLTAEGKADERRALEAEMVAARIREMVVDRARGDTEGRQVVDPDDGKLRDCEYRDVALLFRARTGLDYYVKELRRYGIPYYLAGDAGLKNQQEILDAVNLLRLLDNPLDDLAAFAFLRSPFIGLRDEVIARLRLEGGSGSLLKQARKYANGGTWWDAPEHPSLKGVEQEALRLGLALVEELSELRSRLPADELLSRALDETGYRLHLQLLDQPEAKLANLQRFIRLLEGHRGQTLRAFLDIWQRWGDQNVGIPQAALYSKRDNVVTLSTIHSSKGLEWPVVFVVDSEGRFSDKSSGALWSDRTLGPILCPKKDDRGERAAQLAERAAAEAQAEEARLLYVATTRARDRLILMGPGKPNGRAEWLKRGVGSSVRFTVRVPEVEIPALPPEPALEWLDRVQVGTLPKLALPVWIASTRYTRSATELLSHKRNRQEWKARYVHGVTPRWIFAATGTGMGGGVPASIHGNIVHGVLEQIREEAELAELLDLQINALGSPELQERLEKGLEAREEIEGEIRGVVQSAEWRWYVEGEHYRELDFIQLRTGKKWRVGALDLYRPGTPGHIVDFKTSDVDAKEAVVVARSYSPQAATYKAVCRALVGEVEMRFHFTRCNCVVEVH